jgi:hypothetical protein
MVAFNYRKAHASLAKLELNSELREIYLDPGELHNASRTGDHSDGVGRVRHQVLEPEAACRRALPSVVAVLPDGLDRRKAPGHGMPIRGSATCLTV